MLGCTPLDRSSSNTRCASPACARRTEQRAPPVNIAARALKSGASRSHPRRYWHRMTRRNERRHVVLRRVDIC
eukprot:4045892-Pyramimonas_sp.AAC.1